MKSLLKYACGFSVSSPLQQSNRERTWLWITWCYASSDSYFLICDTWNRTDLQSWSRFHETLILGFACYVARLGLNSSRKINTSWKEFGVNESRSIWSVIDNSIKICTKVLDWCGWCILNGSKCKNDIYTVQLPTIILLILVKIYSFQSKYLNIQSTDWEGLIMYKG